MARLLITRGVAAEALLLGSTLSQMGAIRRMFIVVLRWLCRAVSVFLLYGMTLWLWSDLRIVMDPAVFFGKSLKDGSSVEHALVNAVLLPFVVFLVYFANWGRSGRQAQTAVAALCVTGLAPLAYLVVSLRPSLPRGYLDMELVVGACMIAFLWLGVAVGVLLRWRHIRLSRDGTHPQCEGCRYDLTGNVTGRCPECGKYFWSV